MKKNQLKKGFSLVEMLIVVTLVGILSGVLYTGYNKYLTTAKETATKAEMLEVVSAFEAAMLEHEYLYGTDPETITVDNFTSFPQLFDIEEVDLVSCYNSLSTNPLKEGMSLSFTKDDYLVVEHNGLTITYDPIDKVFID